MIEFLDHGANVVPPIALCALLEGFQPTMAAATGFRLAELLGSSGTEHGVFVLMSIMPFSVATYLLVGIHCREVRRPPAPVTQRSHVPL